MSDDGGETGAFLAGFIVGGLVGAALVQSGSRGVAWSGIWQKVILPGAASPAIGFAGGMWADPSVQWLVGRNAAVARIAGLSFSGFIAWVIWVGLHIYRLIGFRNRILVLINWAWDYFFYENQVDSCPDDCT